MSSFRAVFVVILLLLSYQVGRSAVVNSIDDFQDGTTQGWAHGTPSPNPPENIADVGPSGMAGDDSLQVSSNGSASRGGRFAVYNRESRWTGDYIGAGLVAITADVNNVGGVSLDLRIGIGNNSLADRYATTDAITVGPGSGWTSVTWSVRPSDFTRLQGNPDITAALMDVDEVRILSAVNVEFIGDPIVGLLRLDNITAVPEPAGTSLVALAAVGWVALRRRRKSGRRDSRHGEACT